MRKSLKPLLFSVVALTLVWIPLANCQIYSPFTGFPETNSPMLYNQFIVGAYNGSEGPGNTVTNSTTSSGLFSTNAPFSHSAIANNGGTFSSFVGKVTATETATMTATAAYGTLTVNANATATSSFSEAAFGNFTITAAGTPVVEFNETITIQPTNGHPAGSMVPVTFTEAFTQSTFTIIGGSPDTIAEMIGTLQVTGNLLFVEAVFGQSYLAGNGFYTPLPPPSGPYLYGSATSVSTNVSLKVGSPYIVTGGIYATGQASGTSDSSEGTGDVTNAVDESATSQLYIDTGALGFVSASGATYTLPPPRLSLRPTTGNGVIISWPAFYPNYVLQQNTALGTTNWTLNTNTISDVNGTNQVTIMPATGDEYFRLAK